MDLLVRLTGTYTFGFFSLSERKDEKSIYFTGNHFDHVNKILISSLDHYEFCSIATIRFTGD